MCITFIALNWIFDVSIHFQCSQQSKWIHVLSKYVLYIHQLNVFDMLNIEQKLLDKEIINSNQLMHFYVALMTNGNQLKILFIQSMRTAHIHICTNIWRKVYLCYVLFTFTWQTILNNESMQFIFVELLKFGQSCLNEFNFACIWDLEEILLIVRNGRKLFEIFRLNWETRSQKNNPNGHLDR